MGQRHQLFLRVANPIKFMDSAKLPENATEIFGNEDTTILAFHSQWQYGRSTLEVALHVLQHTEQFSIKEKTSTSLVGLTTTHSPFCPDWLDCYSSNFTYYINSIEFIMGYTKLHTSRAAGIYEFIFLNEEEPLMRSNFDKGDNNDGITIIDTINNKYCFMNINKRYRIENSVCSFEQYKPLTAKQYVNAYYKNGNKECKKINNNLIKQFKGFELLTIEEISKMFPDMDRIK